MRILTLLFTLCLSLAAAPLTITFHPAGIITLPGETIVFRATIFNPTTAVYDLNSASANLTGTLTPDTAPFFLLPLSILPGETLDTVDLFTVSVPDPFSPLDTPFTGTFTILGGAQVGGVYDPSTQDIIGSSDFSLTIVPPSLPEIPEPATVATVATACALLAFRRRSLR